MRAMKNASIDALVGIWMTLLTAFVVTIGFGYLSHGVIGTILVIVVILFLLGRL